VLTPDGEWHSPGEMGWFGLSSESEDEGHDWDVTYMEKFIYPTNPEWTITIVDCHI
jgi:hypothetical protein